VAGNILRHPVINYLPHSVHGALREADYLHDHGLFVGNHHFPIGDEIESLHCVIEQAAQRKQRKSS
ncbi:MAG: hypothetical protein ACRD27_09900, partial [Terracidiphilus sp.]